eukprot:TRINITY_DN7906_c0_g1_i1.p1 TRINITY_DN7906_c0_g1~~TRINITY_DN7906_c0_g1_i1.p1  ORF type:complete len:378 (-),score=128.25 TRINITY_DN7906_c0_g1_i1:94-1227(-)
MSHSDDSTEEEDYISHHGYDIHTHQSNRSQMLSQTLGYSQEASKSLSRSQNSIEQQYIAEISLLRKKYQQMETKYITELQLAKKMRSFIQERLQVVEEENEKMKREFRIEKNLRKDYENEYGAILPHFESLKIQLKKEQEKSRLLQQEVRDMKEQQKKTKKVQISQAPTAPATSNSSRSTTPLSSRDERSVVVVAPPKTETHVDHRLVEERNLLLNFIAEERERFSQLLSMSNFLTNNSSPIPIPAANPIPNSAANPSLHAAPAATKKREDIGPSRSSDNISEIELTIKATATDPEQGLCKGGSSVNFSELRNQNSSFKNLKTFWEKPTIVPAAVPLAAVAGQCSSQPGSAIQIVSSAGAVLEKTRSKTLPKYIPPN